MNAPNELIDLIGNLGREVYYMLDDCETSGDVGEEAHTITDDGLTKVSAILDKIDALPFEVENVILGTGAMLQEALKRIFVDALADRDATIACMQASMAEAVKMLSEQDFEYNRKTNNMIERHAEKIARLQANLDRWAAIDEIMPPDYKDYWQGDGKPEAVIASILLLRDREAMAWARVEQLQARLDARPTRLVTGGGGGTGC